MTTPESWVILKINDHYKVFGSWRDAWKLNSGISNVFQDRYFYYFKGFSGSVYKCHKDHYGIREIYGQDALDNLLEATDDIDVLDDVEDWESYLTKNP